MFIAALQQHPFLRLLLPLVIGIVCGDAFPHAVPMIVCLGIMVLLAFLLPVCFFMNWKYWFGGFLFLLIITTGYTLAARQLSDTAFPISNRPAIYQVTINQTPENKARSILCPAVVTLTSSKDSALTSVHNHPQVLLYFQQDSIAATLKRGDRLWIHARIAPPSNKGIPHEFDYARFYSAVASAERLSYLQDIGEKPAMIPYGLLDKRQPIIRKRLSISIANWASKETNWPYFLP